MGRAALGSLSHDRLHAVWRHQPAHQQVLPVLRCAPRGSRAEPRPSAVASTGPRSALRAACCSARAARARSAPRVGRSRGAPALRAATSAGSTRCAVPVGSSAPRRLSSAASRRSARRASAGMGSAARRRTAAAPSPLLAPGSPALPSRVARGAEPVRRHRRAASRLRSSPRRPRPLRSAAASVGPPGGAAPARSPSPLAAARCPRPGRPHPRSLERSVGLCGDGAAADPRGVRSPARRGHARLRVPAAGLCPTGRLRPAARVLAAGKSGPGRPASRAPASGCGPRGASLAFRSPATGRAVPSSRGGSVPASAGGISRQLRVDGARRVLAHLSGPKRRGP
jgi:hypothetical protein